NPTLQRQKTRHSLAFGDVLGIVPVVELAGVHTREIHRRDQCTLRHGVLPLRNPRSSAQAHLRRASAGWLQSLEILGWPSRNPKGWDIRTNRPGAWSTIAGRVRDSSRCRKV